MAMRAVVGAEGDEHGEGVPEACDVVGAGGGAGEVRAEGRRSEDARVVRLQLRGAVGGLVVELIGPVA